MGALLKQIIAESTRQKEKISKSLNLEFVYQLISRMHQSHLLLSRAYKYATFHQLREADDAVRIMKSLECVAFWLYDLICERRQCVPYSQLRWKTYDLRFYIDFYVTEIGKRNVCNGKKGKKRNQDLFVLGHQKHQNMP